MFGMGKSSNEARGESSKRLEYIEGDSERAAVYVDRERWRAGEGGDHSAWYCTGNRKKISAKEGE